MQAEIRRLKESGYSIRKIAEALGVSRQTVRKFKDEASEAASAPSICERNDGLDWEALGKKARSGVTVTQLHKEYAPEMKYWNFWHHLRTHNPKTKDVSLRIIHQPGERTELDYADGISLVDRLTGEVTKTHLFCGVLAFSGYTFGEFVLNQKLPSFVRSQERMWEFFGGVTPYVVIDNLKSGVKKAHRYDPDVNPTYAEYAAHAGFAVLPARPYKPKDKARVEVVIGVIQRQFYQEVRDRTFYSLGELNEAFRFYLSRLNTSVMKDYGVSRLDRFETEAPLLKSVQARPFEFSERRTAKVHPDCHIQVFKNFYSVPFQNVGQVVRVRITEKLVEIFSEDGDLIAAHTRLFGKGQFSTDLRHYPEPQRGIRRFELRYAKREAEKIGPHTQALVESLIQASYPLKYLRRIQGILRLTKSVSKSSLEYACAQALLFNKPRLGYIKNCAEHFERNGGRPRSITPRRELENVFLHETAEVKR